MADNYLFDAGTGSTAAGDDVGGVMYPRVKMALGADGAFDMDVDSGQQTMANSVPVAIASNQSAIPITDNSGSITVDGSVSAVAAGDVASGASDSGNPVKTGGVAKTSNPTAVTDGQRVNSLHNKVGAQVVVQALRELIADQNTTITSSTAVTTIVTALASTFLDLVSLTLTNISATATEVTLYDDDGTTVRWSGYIPAGDMRGIVFSYPLTQPTVNKAWKLKTVTSVASVKVTAQFIKNV
jgi:hypothetical protein